MAKRVVLFLTCSWLLLAGGHLYSGDEVMMARVTEALVTRGSLSPRPLEHFRDYARVEGRDRQSYTWYGLGPSLAAVPFYLGGMLLEQVVEPADLRAFQHPVLLFYDRQDRSEVVRSFLVSWTNAFVMAAVAWLLFGLLRRQGMTERGAALATLGFGLTGIVPFYARSFFSEPLGALCWMAGIVAWVRARESFSWRWALAAGLAFGALPLARVALGGGLPVAALAVALDLWRLRDRPGRDRVRAAAWMAAGLAVTLGIWAGTNLLRFGHPFESGYSGVLGLFGGDPLEGLSGLLLSPGRGLIWHVPWALPALLGLPLLGRRDPSLAVFSGGLLAALLALYAPWAMWDGGWCFGPRFLVPALPSLAIPMALVAGRWTGSPGGRVLLGLVAAASILVAAASVLVNYEDYHFALWASTPDPDGAVRWDPAWSPLWRYWSWPRKGFLILPRLLWGQGGWALAALAWSLLGTWAVAGFRLATAMLRSPGAIDSPGTSR
ncbi:hypothetical protein KBD49_15325 [Myxococcota bacterium]|nr:hypothetical protein [Myxococcota bacterium]